MGLERRGNKLYLYGKERRGARVVSVYSGKGEIAFLFNQLERHRGEEARVEREVIRQERRKHEQVDRLIAAFCQGVRAVEDSIFLVSGYHQHSRTWRRKRLQK